MTADIDHNRRAQTFARLMVQEHHDAHGGAFRIGDVTGVFLNFGEKAPDGPIKTEIRRRLADQGIETLGESGSGELPTSDTDYSWAAILDTHATDLDDLTNLVCEAVREVRAPNYPRWQFKTIQ